LSRKGCRRSRLGWEGGRAGQDQLQDEPFYQYRLHEEHDRLQKEQDRLLLDMLQDEQDMLQKEKDILHDKQERIKEKKDQLQDEQIGCTVSMFG
jgi:hypothetical protein